MMHDRNGRRNREQPHETDALDDEIARALAVDPSPDFVRRVRTHIADNPRPAAWRAWPVAGATLATVAVMAAVLVWSVTVPVDRHPSLPAVAPVSAEKTEPSPLAPQTLPAAATNQPATEAVATSTHRRTPASRTVRAVAAPAPSQELVGLLALRDSVWRGQVEMPEPSRETDSVAPLIADLTVHPIEIPPLPVLAQLSGDRP